MPCQRLMLFTDSTFLFLFLPTLLALYFLGVSLTTRDSRRDRSRNLSAANGVLLVGSAVSYAAGGGAYSWLIAAAISFNYGIARAIGRAQEARDPDPLTPSDEEPPHGSATSTGPETLVAIAVIGNIALLGIFKYANPTSGIFDPTLPALNERPVAVPQLLAPLGLSFVTCHAISYLVDVNRREAVPYKNPVQTALYLLFFPLLIAGPIVRYRDLSAQFTHRRIGMAAFAYGVRRFAIGLGKTLLIANTLAVPSDAIFAMPANELSAAHAWLGITCFTLQIYFDLSGYADMAIGLGRMLGFRLPENFRWPYAADTVHEFWRRWNITLLGWVDAYVALSLDVKGDDRVRVGRNLLTLFLLIGLWYGPGWNVVIWGLYHGTFVLFERFGLAAVVGRLPAPLRHAYLLLMVMFGWGIFRTETLPSALVFLSALAGLNTRALGGAPLPMTPVLWAAVAAGCLGSVPLLPWLSRWRVTLDAMTTSALMLGSTAWIFSWRQATRVFDRLARRKRR